MSLTRRTFLERLGLAGGAAATYMGMEALGLLNTPPAAAQAFGLPAGSGRGKSVVILGAGIAGLVSAYELRRAGWTVTVLEARDRVGGRVWTLRPGTRIEQTGRPDQVCRFSDGLYLNAGAARLPTAHRTMLGYAKSLGVPIEVMVNANRSGRIDLGDRVVESRQLVSDVRGHVSELLAKSISAGALNGQLTAEERRNMRQFLGFYGELADSGAYEPTGRSGYTELAGAYGTGGHPRAGLALSELLNNPVAFMPLMFEEMFDQQSPMFQPVGGMDRIAYALYDRVRPAVRLNAPVTAIRRRGDGPGVRIEHGPGAQVTEADYCICALPLTTLQRVQSDFSPAKRAAIAGVEYGPSVKVAFESPRFWEDEGVYGGLGWTNAINENLIYPSGHWQSDKGVLVAAYCAGWTDDAHPVRFTAMSHEERFAVSRQSVERLHPGKSSLMRNPVTVAWKLTPWSEGVGPGGPDFGDPPRGERYAELQKPEGPIFFAGEHLSYVLYWQEGAALSAHEAMRRLQGYATANAPARRT